MWLPLGPVLEPLEDAIIALDDPVLVNGSLLHLGGRNGHAKAHFQDPAPWTHKRPGLGRLPREGDTETSATRTEGHNGQKDTVAMRGNNVNPGQWPAKVACQEGS